MPRADLLVVSEPVLVGEAHFERSFRARRPGDLEKTNVATEIRLRRVNGNDLLDLATRSLWRNDDDPRIPLFPSGRVATMVAVRHDEEVRNAEVLQDPHLLFIQSYRAVD